MIHYNWCIDAGNSSIKWGVFSGNRLIEVLQIRSDLSLDQIRELEIKYPPNKIAIASVRGDVLDFPLPKARHFNVSEISSFEVDYLQSSELGVDRLAAALGAKFFFPEDDNILVVDLGTCITYTIVSNKRIIGKAIAPGLQMRWSAMNHFTSQLPLINHDSVISEKGTKQNLYFGGYWGWQKEIEGLIGLICENDKVDRVIFTGSDVVHLEKFLKDRYVIVDYLNLWGLNNWLNEG